MSEDLKLLKCKFGVQIINAHLEALIDHGILKEKFNQIKNIVKDSEGKTDTNDYINSIDVILTEDCNLTCKYCFVKKKQYNDKSALLLSEVGEKIIDFIIRKSGNIKDLFVCFFGGEPLLNFKVMKYMVIYALEQGKKSNKHFHFSITTNATLLSDEVVEFLGEHNIFVVISIDGNKYSHNLNRPLPGNGDSYSIIERNLKKIALKNINYSARVTVSSFTKNKIAENYEHLCSMGFERIHFENAMAPKGKVFINSKDDIKEVRRQYSLVLKKIKKSVQQKEPLNFESLPLPLNKILAKSPRLFSCSAGRGLVSVDVNGYIYVCHRLVGIKSFYLGNVFEDTFSTKLTEINTNEMNVDNRKKCKNCWARYICGGGCYEINYTFNKDISVPPRIYCQLMKYKIKLALYLYAYLG